MNKPPCINLSNSICHFGYWANSDERVDMLDLSTYPHFKVYSKCIRALKKLGFTITEHPRIKKDFPAISKFNRYGIWKGLEVNIQIHSSCFYFDFFQNENTGDRRPGDGEYAFNKRKLMSYLMGKRYDLSIKKLTEAAGCAVESRDPHPLAEVAIINCKRGSGHNVTPVNSLDDFQAQMKDFDLRCNNKDRDKKDILCGQVKYFRDQHTGRLVRGRVYHLLNAQWHVLVNRYHHTSVQSNQLFDPTSEDFGHRRVKGGSIPKERQKELELLKSLTAGKLKYLLLRAAQKSVIVAILAVLLSITLSSCSPSRNPRGEYWKTKQVWRRITAGRSKPVDHQLECPKVP